jgi:hypothetical protein
MNARGDSPTNGEKMTKDEARNDAHENTKPTKDQKHRQPAPPPTPVDPLGSGCGFIPGEGI